MKENLWDLNSWLAKVPNTVWGLLVLSLLGFLLRVWGLDFGLPNDSRPDEWNNENVVILNMLTPLMLQGDWRLNPAVFNYGSLYYAVALLANWLVFTGLQLQGQWYQWQQVLFAYENDPSLFFLVLRWISVLASTVTIPLMWILAKRLPVPNHLCSSGKALPWVVAVLSAACYLWVRNAHFGTPDALFCLLIVISIWRILCFAQRPADHPHKQRDLNLACIAIGLTTGVKYPGLVLMVPLAVALFRNAVSLGKIEWEAWTIACLKAFAFVILVFGITSPWVILDYPNFLSWMHYESAYFTFTLPGIPVGWQFYPTFALFYGVGWGVLVFAAVGSIAAFRHSQQNPEARWTHWVLWSALLAFYLSLGPNLRVMTRYAMPLVPVILLYAGYGILTTWQAFISRRRLPSPILQGLVLVTLVCSSMGQALQESLQLDRILATPDTRSMARDWFLSHVPPNQPVAVGPRLGQIRLPANYGQLMTETGPNNLGYPNEIRIENVSPRTRLISTYLDIPTLQKLGIHFVTLYGQRLLFSNPPWEQELYAQKAKPVFAMQPYKSDHPEPPGIYEPFDAMQLPFAQLSQVERGGPALIIYEITSKP